MRPNWESTWSSLGPKSPLFWHVLVEAKKLAYADLYAYNGDPQFSAIPVDRLISKAYASEQCPPHRSAQGRHPRAQRRSGRGHCVSGHGRSLGQYGVVHLQRLRYFRLRSHRSGLRLRAERSRRACFRWTPHSPNLIAPGRASLSHSAAGIRDEGRTPADGFRLMGGGQQAQGHVQVY